MIIRTAKKHVLAICVLLATTSASFAQCGTASHYGGDDGLCGSKLANGGRLNCAAMTAAHRTLPLGTKLHVTHRHKTITVTINDRGPYIAGRIIDLSIGAARALGFNGLATVCF